MSNTREIKISHDQPGFTCIRYGFLEANKPFIEFAMADTNLNNHYLSQGGQFISIPTSKNPKACYLSLQGGNSISAAGVVMRENQQIIVRATGKSHTYLALTSFLLDPFYQYFVSNNQPLTDFACTIKKLIEEKPSTFSLFSKNKNKYEIRFNTKEDKWMAYKNEKTPRYYYKATKKNLLLSQQAIEEEPAAAALYRLLMGHEGAPKTYSLYDASTQKSIASISRAIKGYKSGYTYLEEIAEANTIIESELIELVHTGIAPMLVASYVFEENDLHSNNWGFNKKEKIVRIDFERSLWPITSKYKDILPKETVTFADEKLAYLTSSPADAFNITAEELLHFPNLSSSKPTNWIVGEHLASTPFDISGISKLPAFIFQKWKYFLKAILIFQPTITEVFNGFLGSEKAKLKFTVHLTSRLAKLEQVLLNIPEFLQFLTMNKNVGKELIEEFTQYNVGIKDKYVCLKVDIDAIKTKLDALYIYAESESKLSENKPLHIKCKL